MAKQPIFNESFFIMRNILRLCSIMFMKGIVDSNKSSDYTETKKITEMEGFDHTTLRLFLDNKAMVLNERQYINMICSYASENNLFSFRNFVRRSSTDIATGCCILLNYIYREGVKKTVAYDSTKIDTMLTSIRNNGTRYFTPEGFLIENAWYDKIREYLTIIELESENPKCIVALDTFLAKTMKNSNEMKTAIDIENERRNFVLSGGKL